MWMKILSIIKKSCLQTVFQLGNVTSYSVLFWATPIIGNQLLRNEFTVLNHIALYYYSTNPGKAKK